MQDYMEVVSDLDKSSDPEEDARIVELICEGTGMECSAELKAWAAGALDRLRPLAKKIRDAASELIDTLPRDDDDTAGPRLLTNIARTYGMTIGYEGWRFAGACAAATMRNGGESALHKDSFHTTFRALRDVESTVGGLVRKTKKSGGVEELLDALNKLKDLTKSDDAQNG